MRRDRAKKGLIKESQVSEPTKAKSSSDEFIQVESVLPETDLEDLYLSHEPINSEIIKLRQDVLHPTGAVEKVSYPSDTHELAGHFVIRKHGDVVAVGSVLPEDESETLNYDVWRIRGMAVHANERGLGLGSLILDEIITYVQNLKGQKHKISPIDLNLITDKLRRDKSGIDDYLFNPQLIWCNARVEALNLYKRAHFEVLPGEFLIPGSTLHNRLHLKL